MELETLARNIAKKFFILLNKEEGIMYGTYAGTQIIYGRNIYNFPNEYCYQDFLVIQNSAKLMFTHIQGDKDSKSLQLMIPSTDSDKYKSQFLKCPEPYNQLGIKLQKYPISQHGIPRIETLDLENFDNADEMILKVISTKTFLNKT